MSSGVYKRKPIIKTGDKFNFLTAVKFDHRDKWESQHWLFKCECGNEKIIKIGNVKSEMTKSCGCLRVKHGMGKTRTYRSWGSMKQRCLNKNHHKYKIYGGSGIIICPEWMKFENFYRDMGERPAGKTLDRFPDNNGNYEPNNCRWATSVEQNNNRRLYSQEY